MSKHQDNKEAPEKSQQNPSGQRKGEKERGRNENQWEREKKRIGGKMIFGDQFNFTLREKKEAQKWKKTPRPKKERKKEDKMIEKES